MRQARTDREDGGGERSGNDGGNGATVGKCIGVLLGRKQRIEGDGNDAGADRPEERYGIVHGVMKREEDAIFRANSQFSQRPAKAVGLVLQVAIAERTLAVAECNLVAMAAGDAAIDQIGGSVVRAAL